MSDTDKKILEAVIKLKDEMTKPIQKVQKSLKDLEKRSKIVNKTMSSLRKIMNSPLMLKLKDKASPTVLY